MLPEHHLPQLVLSRVQAATNRLAELIWDTAEPLAVEASEARPVQCSLADGKKLKTSVQGLNTYWGKLFDQRWCRIQFPKPLGKNTWLHWQDQSESTLYVKDQAFWGFNVAHTHCLLPVGTKEVWLQSTCCQTAIWHPDARGYEASGAHFKGATLAHRNDDVWHAYHDLKCLFDLALDMRTRETPEVAKEIYGSGLQPKVESYSPTFRRLLRWMNEAVDALDTRGAAAMRKHLKKAYQELKVDASFSKCLLSGHAHVDLVWIWPERVGELKAVNVFSTMNRLMEEYPEFRFAYSQPASYEAVKKREPGLYRDVSKRIQSGTWQATGAMYVESDTLIACGEALSRSFAVGQKGFTEINGEPSKLTWLPDVFGYSACLPQIMKQHGVEYFFTSKMAWNAINRFPHSSFVWRGNDGSEVLAHIMQAVGYVSHIEVGQVMDTMHGNMQADVHDEFLLPTGYGDGGGGTTATMLERARRLDGLPGMPSMEWGQPEDFFQRLETHRNRYPVHQGECYLEYHRGTYTTHGNLKAAFRGLERALQVVEAASAATGKSCDVEHAWKRMVFAQFHDYIPGSSVWDVYLEGVPELEGLAVDQEKATMASLSSARGGAECLFNPHAVPVKYWHQGASGKAEYLSLPPAKGTALTDAIVEVPPAVTADGNRISNDRASFRVNSKGWIDSLTWDGVKVPLDGPLGQLVLYTDQAGSFEPWDIDRHVLSLGKTCEAKSFIEPWAEGDHRVGLRVTRAVGEKSSATVILFLESGSPLVHIQVDLDWKETNALLKLHIPTSYGAVSARFGSPFGSVLRPQIPSGMHTEGMWEVPFSRYLAVFDEGEREGLFAVTESKYGASVHCGEVGISLVRSPRVTGFEGHGAAWAAHLTRLKDLPVHSDQGSHSIRLALGRYSIDLPREEQPACVADTLFTPPVSYRGKATRALLESIEGGESLIPCWIQPRGKKGWLLRLHEVSGQRGNARIRCSKDWAMSLVQLDGTPAKGSIRGGRFTFRPYQVLGIRFESCS